MKKFLAISLLLLTGCGGHTSPWGHFFVRSKIDGYKVCISKGQLDPLCISQPFTSPIDADILARELNRDMEGHWEK